MGRHSHSLLGRAIADRASGKKTDLVRRRDDGKVFAGDEAGATSPGFSKEEVQVLEYCGRQVLDLRCGAGRMLKRLADRDRRLSGIDVAPEAVEHCRRAGIDAREADLWDLDASHTYDTVLLFHGQIGIGGTPQGTKRLLEHLSSLLRPGGAIVGTYLDRTESEAAEDKAYFARLRSLGRGPGEAAFRYEYAGETGEPFLLWCPTMDELTSVTSEVGYGIDFVQLTAESVECFTVLTKSA